LEDQQAGGDADGQPKIFMKEKTLCLKRFLSAMVKKLAINSRRLINEQ